MEFFLGRKEKEREFFFGKIFEKYHFTSGVHEYAHRVAKFYKYSNIYSLFLSL